MSQPSPHVFLVGAGPGDPGLLTLRAVECLQQADLVLYDKLVPKRLLDFARPGAECRCVSDLPGEHPQRWPHIHRTLIEAARQGKVVVRLKGGDPLVFGRGGEEAEELRAAGLTYEIVPGVTAGLAAAACAEIPITHRQAASAVAFVTGHENPTKPSAALDWPALARFPGTLVIYMGFARLDLIVKVLIEHGKAADTPAAVVASASTGHQHTVESTLVGLPEAVRSSGVAAPAVIIVGPVAGMKPARSWWESRPLFGKRVVVTRPRGQSADLVRRLEQFGAIPYVLPAVDIRPLEEWSAVDATLGRLHDFDWLVFTSANGVRALLDRLPQIGRDVRALGSLKIAAIGPGTADVLRDYHLEADLVPATYHSEDLAAALAERAAGSRILLARADRGRDLLPRELGKIATVEQLTVYRQVDAFDDDAAVLDAFRRGELDYVTLTSSNIARSLLRKLDATCRERVMGGGVRLVSISPVTSAAIGELGFPVAAEATEYTVAGLLAALVELESGGRSEQVAEGVPGEVK